jgi:hypothetical protein
LTSSEARKILNAILANTTLADTAKQAKLVELQEIHESLAFSRSHIMVLLDGMLELTESHRADRTCARYYLARMSSQQV